MLSSGVATHARTIFTETFSYFYDSVATLYIFKLLVVINIQTIKYSLMKLERSQDNVVWMPNCLLN